MTYDDIQKDLVHCIDFLLYLKKDISSGQTRGYPNVLNALIKLGKIIHSLKKILDKQDNKAIRGSYDDIKNSAKEIHDIVSDSIDKPGSWIKVTGRLESFIADLNDLSELLAEASQSQTKSEEKDGQSNGGKVDSPNEKSSETWYWKLYEKTIKAVIAGILDKVNHS